jgi:probable blue pigment (indigoidine) exporter
MSRVLRDHSHTLALVAAAACWGTATAISKRAVDEIQPLTLLPIELAVSATVLTAALLVTHQRASWTREHRRLGLLGVLNPGISYALSLAGLARITASTSVLLWAIEPILILAIAYLALKDRVTAPMAICAAAALAGVILVVFQTGARADTLGIALTVAGVGACAAYTVMSSKLLDTASSLSVVLLQQVAALTFALVLLAGSFVFGDPTSVRDVSATAWVSAAAAGVLYYAVAFWFYVTGLRGVRPGIAGMFINLIPVFGLAASHIVLDERLTTRQWIGAATILAAVVTIARLNTRTAPPASAATSSP